MAKDDFQKLLAEQKMTNEQLGVIASMEPYMGKYFSAQYVRSKVLKQTEDNIKEMDEQIAQEIEDGILPDPNMPIDPATGMPMDPNMDLGQPMTDPDLESQGASTEVEMPKGGEI